MAETTKIEWADSTLNIWEGCQETGSPACVGCYARARNLRYAPKGTTEAPNWGPHAPRREVKTWRATLRRISRLALAAGRPWFVFVNSLSDFWDNQADAALRAEALAEFRKHPHLTFLLLTKRPQNIVKMVKAMVEADLGPYADAEGILSWWPRNVAIGCTAVTQPEVDRDVPVLLVAKAALNPAFAFLSMEPLAELVSLWSDNGVEGRDYLSGGWYELDDPAQYAGSGRGGGHNSGVGPKLDWVITGGGTDQGGHKAYPSHPDWFREIRDQCARAGVAYMHKQNGEWAPGECAPNAQTRTEATACWDDDGWFFSSITPRESQGMHVDDEPDVWRLGKARAGRYLDGATHDARPAVRT